jgi:cytochrome c oxidase subunit 2
MEKFLGFPVNASAHGPELDSMTALVHWLMLVLFVGWGLYYLYVLFRFRSGRQPAAVYEGAKGKLSKAIEVGVAVVEGILLVVYAVPAWARRVEDFPPERESTVVRVVAQQFAWNVHYPGADGVFGRTSPKLVDAGSLNFIGLDPTDAAALDDIVVQNQLHLPVDKPVIVKLSTLDVIHSFTLPQMRVKQDAIPGMQIPLWFVPTMTTPQGEQWNIACAQLCGNSHYRMKGLYTVQDQAGYEKWLADNAPKPAAAAATAPAAAAQVTAAPPSAH